MASGGGEKAVKKKKETLQVDEAFRKLVIENFWSLTDKKKKSDKDVKEEALPSNYHTWGRKDKILEKSPSLKALRDSGRTSIVGLDCPGLLQTILDELNYPYTIKTIPSIKHDHRPSKVVLVYDIDCFPKVCFRGSGKTGEEAKNRAATFGLNYFLILGK